ncbi:tyrosine-type recombinase/integrase [Alcaligenaceae bacterium CGII-47]|nr:tyrosine-type recombinase/integrase [Alcaligenaceae bacterium CGII-47]
MVSAYLDDGDSRRPRAVPLNDDAVDVIKRRLGAARQFVFTRDTGDGRRIKMHDRSAFQRACKAAGVSDFTWHDLRHTWALWHVQANTVKFWSSSTQAQKTPLAVAA